MDIKEFQQVIDNFTRRHPDCLITEDEQAAIIAIKNHHYICKQLKLHRVQHLLSAQFIVIEYTVDRYTVVYDLSYAASNNEEAVHISKMLDRKLPPIAMDWLNQRFNMETADETLIASIINLHDLIHSSDSQREKWLSAAMTNTQAFFNHVFGKEETVQPVQRDLYQRFFKKLSGDLLERAINTLFSSNKVVLDLIPSTLRTYQDCDVALSHCLGNLRYVPLEHLVKGLFQQHAHGIGDALAMVPAGNVNQELAIIAISCHAKAVLYLSVVFHTWDNFCLAVERHAEAISFIPMKYINEALCIHAVNHDVTALEFIPEKWLTHNVLAAAHKQSGSFFYYVPYRLRSLEVCRLATRIDQDCMHWVPQEFVKAIKADI